MSQLPTSTLDQIPQAAFDLNQGAVSALNPAAKRLLPGLEPGDPAPIPLPALAERSSQWEGGILVFLCKGLRPLHPRG